MSHLILTNDLYCTSNWFGADIKEFSTPKEMIEDNRKKDRFAYFAHRDSEFSLGKVNDQGSVEILKNSKEVDQQLQTLRSRSYQIKVKGVLYTPKTILNIAAELLDVEGYQITLSMLLAYDQLYENTLQDKKYNNEVEDDISENPDKFAPEPPKKPSKKKRKKKTRSRLENAHLSYIKGVKLTVTQNFCATDYSRMINEIYEEEREKLAASTTQPFEIQRVIRNTQKRFIEGCRNKFLSNIDNNKLQVEEL